MSRLFFGSGEIGASAAFTNRIRGCARLIVVNDDGLAKRSSENSGFDLIIR